MSYNFNVENKLSQHNHGLKRGMQLRICI